MGASIKEIHPDPASTLWKGTMSGYVRGEQLLHKSDPKSLNLTVYPEKAQIVYSSAAQIYKME